MKKNLLLFCISFLACLLLFGVGSTSFAYAENQNSKIELLLDEEDNENETYTISFNTNGGSFVQSITAEYGEEIEAPEIPTKDGCTFDGWFSDESLITPYEFETMPNENITIYAKWTINQPTITLKYNNGNDDGYIVADAGDSITLPTPTKEGHDFIGWFSDADLNIPFNASTMPEEDTTIYSSYQIKEFTITLNSNGGTNYIVYRRNYGTIFERPENPVKAGFAFFGWYTDNGSFEHEYDFNMPVTNNLVLYARWTEILYTINFVTNSNSVVNSIHAAYGAQISAPENPTYSNHTFDGWFSDIELTVPYTFSTMPNENITLYARWVPKRQIVLELSPQSYGYDDVNVYYKNFSELSGFNVYYFVNGNWTTEIPKVSGSYDVKIVRGEDATYASFEQTLENGFIIGVRNISLSLVYGILFVVWALELAVIILLKKMKRMKVSKTFALFPLMIGGNSAISGADFVLSIISGVLVLVSFIYIVYLIVDLHRTARNDSFLPSKLDNRERFKEDLVFQNNNEGDSDYEVAVKTDESFGDKYSEDDIRNLLEKDTFNEKTLEKRKFNIEDNSSTNWNKVSESEGSDIISKAKDFGSFKNGEHENRTAVKFFDEDDEK